MAFEVPKLPYAFDALEPHIDAKTMEIHHDKHHAAYVANANAALEKHPELTKRTVEALLWGIKEVHEDIGNVILGVDVCEHAYYLKYQNKRADYVTAWFNTLNWEAINARFGSVWA